MPQEVPKIKLKEKSRSEKEVGMFTCPLHSEKNSLSKPNQLYIIVIFIFIHMLFFYNLCYYLIGVTM